MGYINRVIVCIVLLNLFGTKVQAQNSNKHTIVAMVNSSSDDAEERLNTGRVNLSSPDIELSSDNGKNQIIGLRFNELNIPNRAIIVSAELILKPNASNSDWTSLIICAEDASNAAPFEETLYNISGRLQTLAAVNWSSLSPWSSIDDSYSSPDISKVIQEVVNKDEWKSNNSLALIVEGSGQRTAESFDGSPNNSPTLVIEYIINEEFYTDSKNNMIDEMGNVQPSSLSANSKNEQ
ncbi:MAG: hypothetical protein KDD32_07875 [Bacteroidetes bacterium]|nr:hypothetical protein [Bacteroidota bacterium]